jgi:hypothetical protein
MQGAAAEAGDGVLQAAEQIAGQSHFGAYHRIEQSREPRS